MKLATYQGSIKGGGVESHGYVVANTPHMMEVLSNLYSNKIKAVIRELSTNAYDSHVAAGKKDIPFEVTFPTHTSPYFIIRDYGTGLSYKELDSLYRTYGRSSKTNTNDQVGCLGLGSKSPFNYADEFITTSYYNGEKIVAINVKTENGPILNLVAPVPTDEPNGLEIRIEVKASDISYFQSEGEEVYKWFIVKPITKNYSLNRKPPIYSAEDTNWGQKNYDNFAIMGQVEYSIDYHQFSGVYNKLLNIGFHLFFDIGDLDFSPNRETLRYTDKTKQAITNRLDEIILWYKKFFEESVVKCNSLWAARKLLSDLDNKYGSIYGAIAHNIKFDKFDVDWTVARHIPKYITKVSYNCGNVKHFKTNLYIDASHNYTFVVHDSSFAVDRCKEYIRKHRGSIILVKHYNKSLSEQVLTDYIGILPSEIIYTSNLPLAAKQKTTKKKQTSKEIYCCNLLNNKLSYGHYEKRYWGSYSYKDISKDTGYYVICNSGYSQHSKKRISNYNLHRLINICQNPPRVVGVSAKEIKKISQCMPGFKHISVFIQEKIDNLKKDVYFSIHNTIVKDSITLPDYKIKGLTQLYSDYNKAMNYGPYYNILRRVADEYDYSINDTYADFGVQTFYDKNPNLKMLFEVINYLPHHTHNDVTKQFISYIETLIQEI